MAFWLKRRASPWMSLYQRQSVKNWGDEPYTSKALSRASMASAMESIEPTQGWMTTSRIQSSTNRLRPASVARWGSNMGRRRSSFSSVLCSGATASAPTSRRMISANWETLSMQVVTTTPPGAANPATWRRKACGSCCMGITPSHSTTSKRSGLA